jgi:hypothetical protein
MRSTVETDLIAKDRFWPIAPIDNLTSCPLLAEADMRLDKG